MPSDAIKQRRAGQRRRYRKKQGKRHCPDCGRFLASRARYCARCSLFRKMMCHRKRSKRFKLLNNAKIRKYSKDYYRNNNEYMRKYRRNYDQKQRDQLTDSFVKKLIKDQMGLPVNEIPQELIKLKREHIKLHRLIKGSKT